MAGLCLQVFCAGAFLLSAADANEFLGLSSSPASRSFAPLLQELEGVLGLEVKAKVEQQVATIIESLQSTFLALPQVSPGHLEPAAVRFLLHRYFVDRHGWFVKGFESAGDAWNSSLPTAVFGQHVSDTVQDIFEERMVHRGLNLNEVAVLAATLESMVHSETIERLHAAYQLAGLSQEEHAKQADLELAMDIYMLMYVLGIDHATMTLAKVQKALGTIDRKYPHWGETRKWVREVQKEVLSARHQSRGSFGTTVQVLEEVADRHGRWQDQECAHVKDTLVSLERASTGRVPLTSFYQAALDGKWFLSETKAYLRQSGALDESDPDQPSVIIPNYVNGNSNCIASSKFYSVCCISECEALLGHLERHLATPSAEHGRISELVSQLPSATVEAPRNLSVMLVKHLGEIAALHDGRVPLHGRLFMQWLHHAYPRECPFPLLTGTSKPVTAQQWMIQTGEKPTADAETMRWHIAEGQRVSAPFTSSAADVVANPLYEAVDELPWLEQEELFISQPVRRRSADFVSVAVQGVMLAAFACSMVLPLLHASSKTRETFAGVRKPLKVSV